ncbi:MAG: site-specific integrase [Terriglobales bacterium]
MALEIESDEIEKWVKSLRKKNGLEWTTIDKTRYVMSRVYENGQIHCGLPKGEEGNPVLLVRCKTTSDYEPILVTPEQVFDILQELPELERMLTLLIAATGLRISEALGLQWGDVDYENSKINVRRSWKTKFGTQPTKNTQSKAAIPMHPLLAELLKVWQQKTMYAKSTDWLFPSYKAKGRTPRTGNMLVEDHLRPAALRVGVKGVEDESRRFGFHNLRHALSTYLITKAKVDPKVVQKILRQSDINTTLNIYTHAMTDDRIEAQGLMMEKLVQQKPTSEAVN